MVATPNSVAAQLIAPRANILMQQTQQFSPPLPSSMQTPTQVASSSSGTKQNSLLQKLWEYVKTTLRGQFIALAILCLLFSVIIAAIISGNLRQAYSDIDTIINGSAPSVDAAQTMAQYVEDIDARGADYLATGALTGLEQCPIVGSSSPPATLTVHDCDNLNIDAELALTNHQLFLAAHNVTYPGERTAIERITAGLQEYVADINAMRSEYKQVTNKQDAHDPHLQQAWHDYLMATAVLHEQINLQMPSGPSSQSGLTEPNLPTCTIGNRTLDPTAWSTGSLEESIDCLNSINKAYLDSAYNDASQFLTAGLIFISICCLGFCLLITGTSWRMAMITHRRINIGLSLATALGVIFSFLLISFFSGLTGRHGVFGEVVKDDYASIYSAAQLKRFGTAANADESRWLISLEFGDQTQVTRWTDDWQANTTQVQNLMAAAKANRTWPEEDQPLANMQSNWTEYSTLDAQIRQAATNTNNPNHILDAEQLSTGLSNTTFGKFEDAVDALSAANRMYYDKTASSAEGTLMLYLPLNLLLFPLMGIVAAWGISTRMKEF